MSMSVGIEPAAVQSSAECVGQAALLACVLSSQAPQHLPLGLAALPGPRRQAEVLSGLRAYRANGLAVAHRALAAAYPTVLAMVGEDALKVLARDLWWQAPPTVGDLARWGEGLADWMAAFEPLAEFPWLPDCARLDWAVHCAATQWDAPQGIEGLHLLAQVEPDLTQLVLVPNLQQLHSVWPLADLRLEHQVPEPDTQAIARLLALDVAQATVTLVWRQGWQTHVSAVSSAEGQFMQQLAEGQRLSQALRAVADTDFDFQHWLMRALGEAWLSRIQTF